MKNEDELDCLWLSDDPPPEAEQRMRVLGGLLGVLPLSWQFALLGIVGIKPLPSFHPDNGMLLDTPDGYLVLLGDMADHDTLGHEIGHRLSGDLLHPRRNCPFGRLCEGYLQGKGGIGYGDIEEILCDIFAWHWYWAWWSRGRPK